ncbi:hypothetical protein THAOC_36935, partial [Thalassiosira oceanica]
TGGKEGSGGDQLPRGQILPWRAWIAKGHAKGRAKEDKMKAAKLWSKAAMQGHAESRHNLGAIEITRGNRDRAVRHFLISAMMGHKESVEKIKRAFMAGVATKEQYAQALKGYQYAVEQMKSHNRDEAMLHIANIRYMLNYWYLMVRLSRHRRPDGGFLPARPGARGDPLWLSRTTHPLAHETLRVSRMDTASASDPRLDDHAHETVHPGGGPPTPLPPLAAEQPHLRGGPSGRPRDYSFTDAPSRSSRPPAPSPPSRYAKVAPFSVLGLPSTSRAQGCPSRGRVPCVEQVGLASLKAQLADHVSSPKAATALLHHETRRRSANTESKIRIGQGTATSALSVLPDHPKPGGSNNARTPCDSKKQSFGCPPQHQASVQASGVAMREMSFIEGPSVQQQVATQLGCHRMCSLFLTQSDTFFVHSKITVILNLTMSCVPVAGDDDGVCANCGKQGSDTFKLKNCTACRLVKYCGVDCQRAHRKQHKKACKQRADELKDEQLYSQGYERMEVDFCPICTLPLPIPMDEHSSINVCCMKRICNGCDFAAGKRGMHDCPFCRTPYPDNDADILAMITVRVAKKDPEAINYLGEQYYHGELGLQKNMCKAVKLWTDAVELGSIEALFNLGAAYDNGEGAKEDKKKAVQLYTRAAMQGHAESRYQLGYFEGDKGRYDRAVRHFLVSAKMGDKESVESMKKMLMAGVATKEQYAEALKGYQGVVEEMKSHDRDEAKRLGY